MAVAGTMLASYGLVAVVRDVVRACINRKVRHRRNRLIQMSDSIRPRKMR